MAVTAEDKKYLSSSGIAAVQAATNAWNKAKAAGDQAGMKKAAEDAAKVRASSSYQASGTGGYTTNVDGTYKAPKAVTNPPVTPSKTSTSSSSSNRDVAAEIVALLTQGGTIDYAKLNSLAAERDNKIKSNPTAYGQFEDTQTIINRYLPTAQENERLQNELLAAQTQPSTDVDEVVKLLRNLSTSSYSAMSFNEAQNRASSELNPLYEDAKLRLTEGLNADMEKRGIYNSPLASGILTEKQGKLSNEQIAAIAERANTLIQNDAEMSLQEKQIQSNSLNSLLNSLIGRETNISNLTGYYNGKPTLEREQYNTDKELAEADLTGNYQGQETIASLNARISNALNSVSVMGKVTTQEQADLLGVPIGSSSQAAKQAAADLQQQMEMFNREMGYKQASLNVQRQGQAASDMLTNFNKDLTIWEATGKAPDTAAMRHYGITPGTPWSESSSMTAQQKLQEAQASLELIGAEEELQFQNRATNFMNTHNVNRPTAEAALLIIDQATDLNSAKSIAQAQKSALTAEGVNIDSLSSTLQKYYKLVDMTNPSFAGFTRSLPPGYFLKGKTANYTTGLAHLDTSGMYRDMYPNAPAGTAIVNPLGRTWVSDGNNKWYAQK